MNATHPKTASLGTCAEKYCWSHVEAIGDSQACGSSVLRHCVFFNILECEDSCGKKGRSRRRRRRRMTNRRCPRKDSGAVAKYYLSGFGSGYALLGLL